MNRDRIIQNIEALDAELFSIFRSEFRKQRYSLSLLPQDNASPLVTYLLGSSLSNLHLDYHDAQKHDALEMLAADRAASLFGADEAIVRLASVQVASRMVLLTFLKRGDPILSFHLRKREYCDGDRLAYQFENYSIDPETHELNYDAIAKKAKEFRPKLLIFSPVSYPREVDYERLAKASHDAGALFWVDMGHLAGLIAAKAIASPVPCADVVTCSAHDALHGPQSALILTQKKHSASLHETLERTAHASIRWNTFAALAFALKEAATSRFITYETQVLKNAKALEEGLRAGGAEILFGGTDTHLIMVRSNRMEGSALKRLLRKAGFLVKPDLILTLPKPTDALRLSSMMPTMRGMKEDELRAVGGLLASFLTGERGEAGTDTVHDEVAHLVFDRPLYSEEWLPVKDDLIDTSMEDVDTVREFSSHTKKELLSRMLSNLFK